MLIADTYAYASKLGLTHVLFSIGGIIEQVRTAIQVFSSSFATQLRVFYDAHSDSLDGTWLY